MEALRHCVICGNLPADDGCFRIQIGSLEDFDGNSFNPDPGIYWMCLECAESSEVWIDELYLGKCGLCHCQFMPLGTETPESVIRIEWGEFVDNPSPKGPRVVFSALQVGHAHYWCACDGWNLPFEE